MSLRVLFHISLTLVFLSIASAMALTPRDTTCAAGLNLFSCPSSIPFCCNSGTTCLVPPAANTTVICCPEGQDCSLIMTIDCDTSLQNAALQPTSPIHSDSLDQGLPTCGDACCPLGFQCVNGKGCQMLAAAVVTTSSTSSSSSSSSPATKSTSIPLSTKATATSSSSPVFSAMSTSTSQTTAARASATSSASAVASTTSSPSKGTIVAIVIGVLCAILLLALAAFLLWRRRQQKHKPVQHQPPSPATSSFMSRTPRLASAPPIPTRSINRPDRSIRTDYLGSPAIIWPGPAGIGMRPSHSPYPGRGPSTPERPLLAPSTANPTPATNTRLASPFAYIPTTPATGPSIPTPPSTLPRTMERAIPPPPRMPLFKNPLPLPLTLHHGRREKALPAVPSHVPLVEVPRAPGRPSRSGEFAYEQRPVGPERGAGGQLGSSSGSIPMMLDLDGEEEGLRGGRRATEEMQEVRRGPWVGRGRVEQEREQDEEEEDEMGMGRRWQRDTTFSGMMRGFA